MKKKILLALAILSIFSCIFAISVSAVTIYDDAPVRKNIEVRVDDVVVFDDGFSCPTAYVFKDQNSIANGKWGSPSIAGAFDFTYINGKTGKNYTFENVVELDFPQGLTTIGEYWRTRLQTSKRCQFPTL